MGTLGSGAIANGCALSKLTQPPPWRRIRALCPTLLVTHLDLAMIANLATRPVVLVPLLIMIVTRLLTLVCAIFYVFILLFVTLVSSCSEADFAVVGDLNEVRVVMCYRHFL